MSEVACVSEVGASEDTCEGDAGVTSGRGPVFRMGGLPGRSDTTGVVCVAETVDVSVVCYGKCPVLFVSSCDTVVRG